ncbi:MAG: hypothetical protein EOM21_16005 [Gammaproteobacteria bacterium]|nr:hypothetical protein [Gammaproteobacteria bacterium]
MKLHEPFSISARLMAAVKVGGLTISIDYSNRPGDEHRTRYFYALDFADGTEYEADDLQSGNVGDPGLQYGMESLLGYIEHAAEHYRYHMRDLEAYEPVFTEEIDELLYGLNADEISMLRDEIENTDNLIEEE